MDFEHIYVVARDRGQPQLSSTATILISIQPRPTEPQPVFNTTRSAFSRRPTPSPTAYGVATTSEMDYFPYMVNMTRGGVAAGVQFDQRDYTVVVTEGPIEPYAAQVFPVMNKPQSLQQLRCSVGRLQPEYAEKFKAVVTPMGDCELRIFPLDRENRSSYDIPITVAAFSIEDPYGNPNTSDTSTVHIDVLDTNDNAPVFIVPDTYAPLLIQPTYHAGVAADASPDTKGWLRVQAYDPDSDGNGKVTYSLAEYMPDGKYFGINNETGELVNRYRLDTIRNHSLSYFIVSALATDNPTNGKPLVGRRQIIINKIEEKNRVEVMIDGSTPEDVRVRFDEIVKAFQNYTGPCQVVNSESIKDASKGTETRAIITGKDGTRDKIIKRLEPFYKVARIGLPKKTASIATAGVAADTGSDLLNTSKWSAAQIALVVLACIIAVGSVIAIIVLCCCWYRVSKAKIVARREYLAKNRAAAMNGGNHEKPSLYTIYPANGAQPANSKYNTLYVANSPTDVAEYETQMLEMAMPEDLPSKEGLDVGFTVNDGVYSLRPVTVNSDASTTYNTRPLPAHMRDYHDDDDGRHFRIPPPDYPSGSMSGSSESDNTGSGGSGSGNPLNGRIRDQRYANGRGQAGRVHQNGRQTYETKPYVSNGNANHLVIHNDRTTML